MVELTKEVWDEVVLTSEHPVLVEVYSSTCMPCKMLGKVLEGIEQENLNLRIVKLNATTLSEIPAINNLNINSVPTLVLVTAKKLQILPKMFQKSDILSEVFRLVEEEQNE